MSAQPPSADGFPPGCVTLEIRIAELRNLFNSIDAAPFRERDLDPRAEEFIVGWAGEVHSGAPLGLVVRLERAGTPEETALVPQAVSDFFADRALAKRRELRQLLRIGRICLTIGLAFLASALVVADLASGLRYGILKESLVIGGWVALWRPLEIFLYDWWPVRAEAKLYDRLAAMVVRVVGPARPAQGAFTTLT